jgi:hypothetical protein
MTSHQVMRTKNYRIGQHVKRIGVGSKTVILFCCLHEKAGLKMHDPIFGSMFGSVFGSMHGVPLDAEK